MVDYEISPRRSGRTVTDRVSVSGLPPVLGDIRIVEFRNLGDWARGPALPCALSPKKRGKLAQMARKTGRPLTKRSETSYNSNVSVPLNCLGYIVAILKT